MNIEQQDFDTKSLAALFGVNTATVLRWISARKVRAIRLPGGRYRIPYEEVVRLSTPTEFERNFSS